MLSVEEALSLTLANAGRNPVVEVDLVEAAGSIVAEPVESDVDSPPFTKALMDGYAVRDEDLASGHAELAVLGTLYAGSIAEKPVTPGTAYRIMTGAPLPSQADAIVIVERSQPEGDRVRLEDPGFRPGQNVLGRGEELRTGQIVLEVGRRIGPPEAGLLATVGRVRPKVYRTPSVAILSTGDELVSPAEPPSPGRIRNSNSSTLAAMLRLSGFPTVDLGISRDDHQELTTVVREGLRFDVLLLNGGVSAGDKDLVPAVLAENGVEKIFQGVAIKPGKPVWFGRHANGLAFGLPGNPVSVLACFEMFVRPALQARAGDPNPQPKTVPVRLRADFRYPTRRVTFHPARLFDAGDGFEVEPVGWLGSADMRSVTDADCLLECPISEEPLRAGSTLRALPIRRGV